MHVEYGMSVCTLCRAGKRGQGIRHTLDAPALEYVPATQEVHVADEVAPVALEYVPDVQEVHVADELAPVALEYVPATQEVHVADELAPVALEYVPASQEAHVDAPAGRARSNTATISS